MRSKLDGFQQQSKNFEGLGESEMEKKKKSKLQLFLGTVRLANLWEMNFLEDANENIK